MNHRLATAVVLLTVSLTSACNHWVPRFGTGGRYEEGREQFLRGRAGDLDTAIVAFDVLKVGNVGVGGSTGAVVDKRVSISLVSRRQ